MDSIIIFFSSASLSSLALAIVCKKTVPPASLNLPSCCIEGTSVLRLENAHVTIHIPYHLALSFFLLRICWINVAGYFYHYRSLLLYQETFIYSCIETIVITARKLMWLSVCGDLFTMFNKARILINARAL